MRCGISGVVVDVELKQEVMDMLRFARISLAERFLLESIEAARKSMDVSSAKDAVNMQIKCWKPVGITFTDIQESVWACSQAIVKGMKPS